ncbi:leukocyte antigen CD37-like isoform X2 [Carcharodon carcharias]|uniref:leukocyte antigen CD37-like isoform X2 n=1 Tax=Carcharodon carcharias TaxID=13397 RepID=UPI001B7F1E28|nr:leukocyte antigen CD37-like isoform X2 [Carcharodon carcharias]
MATKGCFVVTKYFLFVFNLIFFFLGGVMLAFGLWILFDKNSFILVLETASVPLRLWSYLLSSLGTFTMVMGFLGCIGALKEVKCMLGIITVGVLIYTQRKMIEKHLSLAVKDLIEKYNETDGKLQNEEESWDFIQFQFFCCGWNSSLEWMKNPQMKHTDSQGEFPFPCSCYRSISQNNSTLNITKETGFCSAPTNPLTEKLKSCKANVFEWIRENILSIMIVSIGVSLLEIFAMTLSMLLCRNIDPDYDKLIRFQ